MSRPALPGKQIALAAVLLVISVFALTIKLSRPSTIQVVVDGQTVRTQRIPNVYDSDDIAWIIVPSCIAGGCIVYLLKTEPASHTPIPAQRVQKKKWLETVGHLQGPEKEIYECLLASDGVALQSDVVRETKLGKGTVSIVLGRMEAMGLLEKRRSGMKNVVVLQK